MKNSSPSTIKWRALTGLVILYIAMWYDWQWIWGLFFLIWVIPDIFSGTTHFMQPVTKKENPILYWIIIFSWILMSLYALSSLYYGEEYYYQY